MKDQFLAWLMDKAFGIPGLRGRFYQWVGNLWALECERLEREVCAKRGHIWNGLWAGCRVCHHAPSVAYISTNTSSTATHTTTIDWPPK